MRLAPKWSEATPISTTKKYFQKKQFWYTAQLAEINTGTTEPNKKGALNAMIYFFISSPLKIFDGTIPTLRFL
jgi:hypothetical protein